MFHNFICYDIINLVICIVGYVSIWEKVDKNKKKVRVTNLCLYLNDMTTTVSNRITVINLMAIRVNHYIVFSYWNPLMTYVLL